MTTKQLNSRKVRWTMHSGDYINCAVIAEQQTSV
jgi:hypothetical protein